MNKLQTTGSYDMKSGDFSISICPNDNHLFTLDGLSIEDMNELKSLIDILLESYNDDRSLEYNLREAEYYDKRAQLDATYNEMISKGYTMTDTGLWIKPEASELDKVVRWILPIEKVEGSEDLYVTFPEDLLQAANLKEGDQVEWNSDNNSLTIKKVNKPLNME